MDVNTREFLINPYVFYDQRRAEEPVFKRGPNVWTITGYHALSSILANPSAGRGNVGQTPRRHGSTIELDKLVNENPSLEILQEWMLFQNPPDHTKSRGSIAAVFTTKMIDKMEAAMRVTMRELLHHAEQNLAVGEPLELVSSLAYPFPATVICEMIGIPIKDRKQFIGWTSALSEAVEINYHQADPLNLARINQAAISAANYFENLINEKGEHPGNDLISRLILDGDDQMSDHRLLSNAIFLLFAGQETTTSLLSNAVHALLMNPDQLRKIREDPGLIKNAVEECLRYDPSIQMVGRLALDNIEIDNVVIQKGDHIFAFLGAAGRDPLANYNPHKFDVSRTKINHLAFTRGTHHCLGAILARLEIRVFIEELINRFEYLELAPNSVRRSTWLMRGFDKLPVFIRPRSSVLKRKTSSIEIQLGKGLYPFHLDELAEYHYAQYRLLNVYGTITPDQQSACIEMWMRTGVLNSVQEAQNRAQQVCYLIEDINSKKVVGVSTLYLDSSLGDDELFYANRMFIEAEHRNTRLMIIGTAMIICFAKFNLANKGVRGVININENNKLSRPGMQRIFRRLGYRHLTHRNDVEVLLFEFDLVDYH